jgi:hypothetical protein
MPYPTLPTTPLTAELAQRLSTRLADLKGSFGNTYMPPHPPSGPYDALILPGTLSLVPNPAETLQNLLPYLRPEGAILGWVLGAGAFPELQHACKAANFTLPPALPAVQDVGSLLQRLGLALPVIDRDLITLTAPNFTRLMHHLKTHGALQRPPQSGLVTPRRWAKLAAAYPTDATTQKPVLTLEIIFFHAIQPGPTLPKAAKRGSGTVPLVKILAPA